MKYLIRVVLVLGFTIIGAAALVALLMVSAAQLLTNVLPKYPEE